MDERQRRLVVDSLRHNADEIEAGRSDFIWLDPEVVVLQAPQHMCNFIWLWKQRAEWRKAITEARLPSRRRFAVLWAAYEKLGE